MQTQTPIQNLIAYLHAHKGDVISLKHLRVKAQDLGICTDDAAVWLELERAGFSSVNGACELIVKPDDEIKKLIEGGKLPREAGDK